MPQTICWNRDASQILFCFSLTVYQMKNLFSNEFVSSFLINGGMTPESLEYWRAGRHSPRMHWLRGAHLNVWRDVLPLSSAWPGGRAEDVVLGGKPWFFLSSQLPRDDILRPPWLSLGHLPAMCSADSRLTALWKDACAHTKPGHCPGPF